jgi:uncharacterized protein (DUF3084 family)
MHTALTLALLIVIATLVSALGDRMGRLAAKRKVAFLGMRPRMAASWIAVFTGVFIALGTVGLLSLLSSDVRQMLFQFEELKANLQSLQAEVNTLEFSRKTLAEDKGKLEKSLTETRTELGAKAKEAQTLTSAIDASNRRRAQVMQELAKTNTALAANRKRLDEIALLLKTQEGSNEKLRAEQSALQDQVSALTDTKSSLITEAASLEQRIEALRQGNLAYEVNQPLKYIPVQAAQTLPESQRSIVEGLNELRQEMEARGLEFQPVPAEAMTQLLDTISLLTDNVIVVVYSAKNVLPGEKVEVTFEIAYDRVIFRKGEVLTRINIDADVNRDKLPALFANAFAAIRNVALAKGMLPNIGTGDVGAITSTDVAKAAEEIEAVQGKRVMEIRAGRDFKTTDTMDSFEIVVKKA